VSTKAAVGVLALVVAVVGLIVGLVPHSIPVAGDVQQSSLSCGSAFAPKDVTSDATLLESEQAIGQAISGYGQPTTASAYVAQCSDAVSTPRVIALVLLGLGALAGLFLLMTNTARRPSPAIP